MAKKRMNDSIRQMLFNMVDSRVKLNDEQDKATAAMDRVIHYVMRTYFTFPAEDMAVLERYHCTDSMTHFTVANGDGNYTLKLNPTNPMDTGWVSATTYHFKTPEGTRVPTRTKSYIYNDTVYAMAKDALDIYKQYLHNLIELKKQYSQFIKSHKYYEDICEDWPEAKEIASRVYVGPVVATNASYQRAVSEDLRRRGVI